MRNLVAAAMPTARRSLLAAALATVMAGSAAAEAPPVAGGLIAGAVTSPATAARHRVPAVLILADAPGADARADGYVHELTAAGLLVMEADAHAIAEATGLPATEAGLAAAASLAVRALAHDPRAAPGRIGVLGFGEGGRAALLAVPDPTGADAIAARAVLYPGCIGLADTLRAHHPTIATPVLLLHGDRDAANPPAACAETAAVLAAWVPTERRQLAGAAYAWDRPAYGADRFALLPVPGGDGRIPGVPHQRLAAESAARVARWMARTLAPEAARP
ncbi:hypothetical protein GXW78_13280 [Roseomonas terrae]|uniref:Dienelactone hydrolase domain-containing protein n=1 Tax=Neoroseomonas terrae TaxID=424799 RepID=A0ABS5EI07_9PROT|nr:dienelactone hydrolase family protein [Neoroseomonas terrae]MBR0650642.1 hypothetical protein [Neoroseomonas terrae]